MWHCSLVIVRVPVLQSKSCSGLLAWKTGMVIFDRFVPKLQPCPSFLQTATASVVESTDISVRGAPSCQKKKKKKKNSTTVCTSCVAPKLIWQKRNAQCHACRYRRRCHAMHICIHVPQSSGCACFAVVDKCPTHDHNVLHVT